MASIGQKVASGRMSSSWSVKCSGKMKITDKKLTIDFFSNSGFVAMSQGFFYTSPRQDIKRFTIPVHAGMERLLPSDGIDAIEKRQFGGNFDVLVCHLFDARVTEKNTYERQKLFWREVRYIIWQERK